MALDKARSARGALAGATAAAVWAAVQPLDELVLRGGYDDVALLGKAVTRGPAWPAVGFAWHVANGAAFGAAYAHVAPRLPLPRWARGPAVALAENFAAWPLAPLVDRFHPARNEMPAGLLTNGRALAQSTWRHLVFGAVLGELERRLNPPPPPPPPVPDAHAASGNGHGDLRVALTGEA
jgi:hypothetical protein